MLFGKINVEIIINFQHSEIFLLKFQGFCLNFSIIIFIRDNIIWNFILVVENFISPIKILQTVTSWFFFFFFVAEIQISKFLTKNWIQGFLTI